MKFNTILIDPPWEQKMSGSWKKHKLKKTLDYPTMSLEEIEKLPVNELGEVGCHLYLWTTNSFLYNGFNLLDKWGYKYLNTITWVKSSGCGNWFINRTQTILFGYKEKCVFKQRFLPNVVFSKNPRKHSEKPQEVYELIEKISFDPRLELFARKKRENWLVWGNEVESDIKL